MAQADLAIVAMPQPGLRYAFSDGVQGGVTWQLID